MCYRIAYSYAVSSGFYDCRDISRSDAAYDYYRDGNIVMAHVVQYGGHAADAEDIGEVFFVPVK